MEDFIKKIFDIDNSSDNYKKFFEDEKSKLVSEQKSKLDKIDENYFKILENEKTNLKVITEKLQIEQEEKLKIYKNQANSIRSNFDNKKESLLNSFSKVLLESGDFNER